MSGIGLGLGFREFHFRLPIANDKDKREKN